MTSDGHKLRETWNKALNDAITAFQNHLVSGQSSSWKRLPISSKKSSSDNSKGKARNPLRPDARDVSVYRKTSKTGDVYRIILDVPAVEETADLEAWRATIVTPELRQEWDSAVESAQVLELCDPSTRIVKTNFTLGWPANPRDAVLISRTFHDASTVVDISTSLPRSPDEPSYLRPSPPYVRSHVPLFAWCIQLLSPEGKAKRVRVTCFWQHDLKTLWNIGIPANIPQQLSSMVVGLLETVKTRQLKVPILSAYGLGVSIERLGFDTGRAALTIDYVIVPEDQETAQGNPEVHSLDDLYTVKEQRRLQRSLKLLLPSTDGWDIRIATRASSETMAQLPWSTSASKYNSSKVSFQIQHAPLLDDHSVLKVKLITEFSAALKGVRVNGLQHAIEDSVDYELKSFNASSQVLKDASSAANVSLTAASTSTTTAESDVSDSSSLRRPPLSRTDSGVDSIPRGPAFDKSILARIRRNYIYFSSLLQEPEAKWKRNSDVRGVSVTQLDSIDPTLVVYKAEATFVGIGLWDLYSAIVTPGTRAYWDRQYEDATLLEDVNELTELWHFKTKPAWPVTGRDCVVLKTVYKSPTTIHVFSFSVDDPRLFPVIPPVEAGTIRTQVDLQGWAIEALSPTTTQLTLLEQSDPKGWTGKSTVPQQMIAAVAGVGEFAIKHGGPPVLSRLTGARSISQKYDHERGLFRVEYEPSVSRRPSSTTDGVRTSSRHNSIDNAQVQEPASGMITPERSVNSTSSSVECELRCDIDTWATSFDIVIDPPPQSITCLRRHRFSAGGGGLWLTVGHDIPFNSEERLQAIVRRAPVTAAKEKGVVMVNGKRITVDVEDLPESEVKSLAKQKRVKPVRVPLDQPPVIGAIRRRRTGLDDGDSSDSDSTASLRRKRGSQSPVGSTAPKVPSPLSTFFTTAIEQVSNTTQQAVAALVPPAASSATFPEGKKHLHYVLDALSFAQSYHRGMYRDNWTNVTETSPLQVQKRSSPEISPTVPVYRGEKVIEGVTADEVASVVFSYDCRKQWDDRFDSVTILEEYGADCHTAFLVAKTRFPFRDRGFVVASVLTREDKLTASEVTPSESDLVQSPAAASGAIYCVSASFNPASLVHLSSQKYNPHALPIGRVYIDAWIMETLDPYTTEKYAIPSMRCIRLTSVDVAGSAPVAFNTVINASLPRAVLSLESYVKTVTPFPEMRFPPAGFRLARTWADEERACWKLRHGCSWSILLNSKLDASSRSFTANLLITFDNHKTSYSSDEGKERDTMQVSPRSGRVVHLSRPASPDVLRRQRADSAGSLSPSNRHRRQLSSSVETTSPISDPRSRERIGASSSALTMGRNQSARGPVDLIIAEVVVDLRTYPDGYDVQVHSVLRPREDSFRFVPLSQVADGDLPHGELPIAHSVHVLPPSPLYTSGTGVDTPTRHLVRLMLPTAQYELPSVEDPLTGEIRNAPPKPQWYRDLEEGEKHAIVRITLCPLPEDKQKKNKKVIYVDGSLVSVSEKDIYKGVVSDELSAAILSRTPVQEGEDQFSLPEAISSPLAVQDSLLEPGFSSGGLQNSSVLAENQNDESTGNVDSREGNENDISESSGRVTPAEEKEAPPSTEVKRGLFGFMNSYRAPFSLQKASSSSSTQQNASIRLYSPLVSPQTIGRPHLPHNIGEIGTSAAAAVVRSVTIPRYSLSTLIVWVLIAFLLGSLLRSLLSPADFIYVVTDLSDVPEGVTRGPGGELGPIEPGWREIKRLVEVKYIVGGWDFQIAVVRRH